MAKYTIKQYEVKDYNEWNAFISSAKNATFLFHRDFMEYHSDRFQDYSLLIFEENTLVAVLPANRVEDTIFSHQGLSYGGLVLNQKTKLSGVIHLFRYLLLYLEENKIKKLNLKILPSFYCDFFSDDIEYCLFLVKANLYKRDALAVIDLAKPLSFSKDRKDGINRGIKNNLVIKEETKFKLFWDTILGPNLNNKHKVSPVHSSNEIISLSNKFPENIKLFTVYHLDEIVAGTVVFISKNVVHSQYISGNSKKNELGSLDFLHNYLINERFNGARFFDFGNSNLNNGLILNSGLSYWKESFGAKTCVQNYYEIATSNYTLLDKVIQ